ncbi:unnamed protein product [Gadus morhua 'NCC']
MVPRYFAIAPWALRANVQAVPESGPRTSSQPPPGHLVPVHRSSLSTENVSPCFHFESDSLLLHCGEDTPKNHMAGLRAALMGALITSGPAEAAGKSFNPRRPRQGEAARGNNKACLCQGGADAQGQR